MKINDILVPVDFSPNSMKAAEFALSLVDPEGEVCLLHVIDSDFIERVSEEGFSEAEQAIERLRESAEKRLGEIVSSRESDRPEIDIMVVVGKPFAEILRVANDLFFEMIVLSTRGRRQSSIEDVLFGSTADKVLRAARIPVICIPPTG
ncbi:MAG: universal stress protein [Acidobacteria bacterium]|nr:universal stress protein [Acidobacteriota bacterium]